MKKLALLVAVLFAFLAEAGPAKGGGKKSAAEQRAEDAEVQSCETAKEFIAGLGSNCGAENARMANVDCKKKVLRQGANYQALSDRCLEKARAGSKSGAKGGGKSSGGHSKR